MRTMKTRILALLTLVVMCTAGTFAQDRKTRQAVPHGIHALHRGSQGGEGAERPTRHQEPCSRLGQLRHGVHRLPRVVVDRPDDYQHLCRKLQFQRQDRHPLLHLRLDLPRRDAGEDCRTHARRPSPERLRSRGPEYRRHHGMAERD